MTQKCKLCWYCSYPCKPVIGVPKKLDKINKEILVSGFFCSFECCL